MIDAHVHVWRLGEHGCVWPTPDLGPIHRDFGLEDLRGEAGADALEGVVLVQSQEAGADTEWLLGLAEDPLVLGVVGWTDFAEPLAPRHIAAIAGSPKLKALRPMVQDRRDDWYDDPALEPCWQAMIDQELVLDALVRPRHLVSLAALAERHAGVTIVVDHAAKPDFGRLTDWRESMRRLAAFPNVSCKLSGLLTELTPDHARGGVETAFGILWHLFGPARLIWGSDWPVVRLAGSYASWLGLARRLVPHLHHAAVFGANARRVYRLAGPAFQD